jgi:quercetin dioxygenase-like cupin family protein
MSEGAPVRHFKLNEMAKERVNDQLERRLITGKRAMFAQVLLDKGCVVPKHAHDNEQITFIVEGALKFWIGEHGEHELIVGAGEVLLIPSGVPHKAEALEDTVDYDIFTPPREDWLTGTDAYLRG